MAYGIVNACGIVSAGGGVGANETVSVPSQNGNLVYTGNEQLPAWNNYDSTKMTIGGTTSATNAGTYEVTFTPKSGYQWVDGTTSAQNVTWTIGKAIGSLSLNTTSLSLESGVKTGTITVTRDGDGEVNASSSNTGAATVSVSGTTITIKAVATGTATVTVGVAEGTNYTAPESKTVDVTVIIYPALLECTPAQIQEVAQSGQAANYWSLGDYVPITLNGPCGDYLTFDNETYYAYIIGFNHNAEKEGDNTIHFQFGMTEDRTRITFIDSEYGSGVLGKDCLCMTESYWVNSYSVGNTTAGGWEACFMRNTICPIFLATMPQEWQDIIMEITKYTDNVSGGEADAIENITATKDKIWLLSNYEIWGETNQDASNYEQYFQARYDYYLNNHLSNSSYYYTQNYAHNDTTTACYWYTRSPERASDDNFVFIDTIGDIRYTGDAFTSRGFCPCFAVG